MAEQFFSPRAIAEDSESKTLSDSLGYLPNTKIKSHFDGTTRPAVLVSCGSFSPITVMHLRMFEDARDFLQDIGYSVLGGFVSPVHDSYQKQGLASASNRLAMAAAACSSSSWIEIDPWESRQLSYTRSLTVLDRFATCVNALSYDVPGSPTPPPTVQVFLLCGADLLKSFVTPGVWIPEQVEQLLSRHGVVCLEREGFNATKTVHQHDLLYAHRRRIHIVPQLIQNNVSSSDIRRNVRRGRSIAYLVPPGVEDIIRERRLYQHVIPRARSQRTPEPSAAALPAGAAGGGGGGGAATACGGSSSGGAGPLLARAASAPHPIAAGAGCVPPSASPPTARMRSVLRPPNGGGGGGRGGSGGGGASTPLASECSSSSGAEAVPLTPSSTASSEG